MCIWTLYCNQSQNEVSWSNLINILVGWNCKEFSIIGFGNFLPIHPVVMTPFFFFFTLFQVWPWTSHISWVGGLFPHIFRGSALRCHRLQSNNARKVLKILHFRCLIALFEPQQWPSSLSLVCSKVVYAYGGGTYMDPRYRGRTLYTGYYRPSRLYGSYMGSGRSGSSRISKISQTTPTKRSDRDAFVWGLLKEGQGRGKYPSEYLT